jgi:hypothetical protein
MISVEGALGGTGNFLTMAVLVDAAVGFFGEDMAEDISRVLEQEGAGAVRKECEKSKQTWRKTSLYGMAYMWVSHYIITRYNPVTECFTHTHRVF